LRRVLHCCFKVPEGLFEVTGTDIVEAFDLKQLRLCNPPRSGLSPGMGIRSPNSSRQVSPLRPGTITNQPRLKEYGASKSETDVYTCTPLSAPKGSTCRPTRWSRCWRSMIAGHLETFDSS